MEETIAELRRQLGEQQRLREAAERRENGERRAREDAERREEEERQAREEERKAREEERKAREEAERLQGEAERRLQPNTLFSLLDRCHESLSRAIRVETDATLTTQGDATDPVNRGDRCLTEDPYEHGPKVVDLIQNMEFPKLDGNPLIDNVINKCWHNKYVTVSELAAHTKTLLNERTDGAGSNGDGSEEEGNREEGSNEVTTPIESSSVVWWRMVMGRVIHGLCYGLGNSWTLVSHSTNGEAAITERGKGDNSDAVDKNLLGEAFLFKKEVCLDLERRGLLRLLCSGEPEQIGFTFDWYRHSL